MALDSGVLERSGKALEDRFFLEQDRVLIEKLCELRKMEKSRPALAAVSGIANPQVLQKLVELEVRPETVASLAVVPLIEVAWADGRIEEKERLAIMEASAASGMAKGSHDYALLEHWLSHRPGPELLEAWTHYVEGLAELLSTEERRALEKDLVDRARRVADAAGGFLGLTSRVSEAEHRVLEALHRPFRL